MSTLDELKRAEQERRQAERQNKKTSLYDAVKFGNQQRQSFGNYGRQLQDLGNQYNNSALKNIGGKMYKYSGEQYLDNLQNKAASKIGQMFNKGTDNALNTLNQTGQKISNPLQTGSDMWNSGLDKLSQETGSQLSQTGGSAISDAVGNEVAGNTANAGGSALGDALATETGGAGLQTAGEAGLQAGAETAATSAGTGAATTGATAAGTSAIGAGAGGATTAGATAGTTAATGAATGAASAGMAAVPIIGWIALAAKLGYDMWSAHKKKQQGAAMQADALADQEMEQDQNKAFQEQAQSESQMQKFTDMINKQLGQGGTDNPYAQYMEQYQKQQDNLDLDKWEGEDESQIDETSAVPTQQTTEQEVASDAANTGLDLVNSLYSDYQGGNSGNTISGTIQQEAPQYVDSLPQGQIESFAPREQQPLPEQPQDYQTGQLVQQAQTPDMKEQIYNQLTTGETGVQNYNKPELMEQQPQMSESKRSAIYDIIRGYNENATHKLGDNRQLIPEAERNWKTRLGEGLGTASRIAQNPLVQGLVAGGIDYAVNGNAKSALSTGASYMSDRAKTNSYRDLLQQGDNPIYYNPGILGSMTSSDYRTMMQQPLQSAMTENYKQKAVDQKLKNEATQAYNSLPIDLRDIADAKIKYPTTDVVKLVKERYPNATDEEIMTYVSGINTTAEKMLPYYKHNVDYRNSQTNASKQELALRKQERTEKGLPNQISEMRIIRSGGGGGGYSSNVKPQAVSQTSKGKDYIGKIVNDDTYGSKILVPDEQGNLSWMSYTKAEDKKKADAMIKAYKVKRHREKMFTSDIPKNADDATRTGNYN